VLVFDAVELFSCVVMKYLVVLLSLLLVLVSSLVQAADKQFGNVFVSEVTSIYDADTFRVNIKGWPDIIGKHMSIRVLGVDAPEIRGKCDAEKKAARLAKQFTVNALRSAKLIELKNIKRGKYFRILAEVYIDGENLAEALIRAKQARPYDGGTRSGWCDKK
jgi:endonuclease YncB( thermonuclease family)